MQAGGRTDTMKLRDIIADMLPQHITYKDKIYYNVTLARLHTSSLRMVEDRNM
jgi:hypothetical protein